VLKNTGKVVKNGEKRLGKQIRGYIFTLGETMGGGGEGYPIETSYKKLGYPISLSYIYLLSPYKGQRNFKTDLFT
jgi:hypothetical protein